MRVLFWIGLFVPLLHPSTGGASPDDRIVPVFDEAPIEFDQSLADATQETGYRVFKSGQVIETTLELPFQPPNPRDAQRLVITLIVEPVILKQDGKLRPGDPWNRLGSVSVVTSNNPSALKSSAAASPSKGRSKSPAKPSSTQPAAVTEVELMRFITGFGGPGTFTADVTALAPLLDGKTTLRVFISTYSKPAWKVTLILNYTAQGAGYRRPVWTKPLFNEEAITAQKNKVQAVVQIPEGLARARVWITSTGHASDGAGGDEFISRTHVLRIDGLEVARWRPWAEQGGSLRAHSPASGRATLDGRELWSSDLDRSGWHPGLIVEPLRVPVPELTPGRHTIELEILNIRPKDQKGHGYWRTHAVVVADEPWPDAGPNQP